MYLKPGTKGTYRGDSRWGEGIYLGMVESSEEYLIGTEKGVIKVRTVCRHGNKEGRWNKEMLAKMVGVPWEPIPAAGGVEVPAAVELPQREGPPPVIEEPEEREITRRRVFIMTVDVKQYGGSPDCPGCDWVKRNKRGPKRESAQRNAERE